MKKLITILMISLFFGFASKAQLKIGAPAGAPNASAILDLNAGAANRGLLLPSVALTGTTSFAPLAANVPGMMVFNTATVSDVTPGIYYNDGTKWAALTSSNSFPPATFTGSTLTCAAAPSGTYQVGVPMASSNTKQVSINTATAGTYTASTNTVNGVTFAATGTILSTGTTNITLNASGTPTASGPISYTVTIGGQPCNFSVTFAGAATFNCSGATQAQSPTGNLTTSSTGSYTVTYTGGNGTAYGSLGLMSNGYTLTRTAGTYAAAGGSVVYVLGAAAGSGNTANFITPECGAVSFGDVLRNAIVAGGVSADLTAYDNATTNTVIKVAVNTYNAVQVITGALTLLNDNIYMATNPPNGGISGSNFTAGTPATVFAGTYFTAGQYIMAFQLKNKGFGTGASDLGGIIKFASSATGPYTDYCGAMPAFTLTANYTPRYYVIKTPGNALPASPQMAVYASSNWGGDHVGAGSTSNMPVPFASGNNNTLTANGGSIYNSLYIQAIVLPTKKW